jgi:ABC-2 type transport system permease protein
MTGVGSISGGVRAELRKAVTLPAVWAGAAVGVVGSVALAVLNAVSVRGAVSSGQEDLLADSAGTSPFESGVAAMPITGVLGALVVGVVVIGSEYTADRAESGGGRQIATTLVASPRRVELLVSKMVTVLALVVAMALVAIPVSVGAAWVVTGSVAEESVALPDALLRSGGATLYWACMGLIAFAVTVLTRSGTIPLVIFIANSSLVSVTFLLSQVTELANWLPDMAGRNLFGIEGAEGGLEPLPGALVMLAWTLVLLFIAGTVFERRDG